MKGEFKARSARIKGQLLLVLREKIDDFFDASPLTYPDHSRRSPGQDAWV